MWTEFQRSGIFDEVVQWRALSTFLETLTFVSACWWFCFPELPRPPVPADEFESIQHLVHLDMILKVLTLVRIALQIPTTAVSHTRQAAANRYELHRCRMTAYLLVCFLQRLVSQDNAYIPPFFEVLHFYKTSLLRDVMYSSFADQRHLKSLRARLPDLCDFMQDPGHHQQPCVYIRLSPWRSPCYIGAIDQDVLRREHSRCRKYLQLLRGQHAFFEPALHYWKRANNYWLFCAN